VSRSHGPDEFPDPRDTSAEAVRDPWQRDRPEPSREQGQGSGPQENGRLTPNRAPEPAQARSAEPREIFEVRGKTYRLRSSEIQILSELGKFRAVATKDLQEFAYHGDKGRASADVQNLIRHGLIAEKKIPHPDTSPRRLLTLSKQGHQFLTVTKRIPKNQAIHYGFTKPREAHHDADLYRMYYTAAEKIERQGGRNLRVILDYELKKRVYHDLAKLGPHRESTAKKKEIAERHGLQVIRGKIPLPDLRGFPKVFCRFLPFSNASESWLMKATPCLAFFAYCRTVNHTKTSRNCSPLLLAGLVRFTPLRATSIASIAGSSL